MATESTSTTDFELRPARFSDLSSIATVWAAAFFDDEIIGEMMHPHRHEYPDDVYWFLLRGVRERFWDWRHQFIVVTDDGKIVGAADWRRLGRGGEEMELGRVDPRNLIAPLVKTYHSMSLALFPNRAADPTRASFLDTAVASSEKYWAGHRTECWDLHVCGVHPDYQGKGAGKLLAQWGVREAQQEAGDVVASVLCGEKNRGFYTKAGMGVQVSETKGDGGGIALFTR
ncbi:acyl-CoA N-acyltransferase [Alternaria rosae]|uniref:acyl-CoA N-acyltransferase n=1 Tax=Alternaria rosae TaxID=1187941 RepID=UPI001E8EC0D8|nr:acyl-CoA N-acyltransferase [Alternaria rosae]KAH6857450.1 acyl-CoA N-acyltransferase [Alternaria rosae]